MSSPTTRRYRTAAGTPRRRPRVRRASTRLTPMRAGAILAMLISAGAIYGLASTSVVGFGRLEITGNVVTPADTIRDQVDLAPGTNLVGLATGPIVERLLGIRSVLDPVDLDAAKRLASITPEQIGSHAQKLGVTVTDEKGFTLEAAPRLWTAVFGFYGPSQRTPALIPGQAQLLTALIAGREDTIQTVVLGDDRDGTYIPKPTPRPSASPRSSARP